jgi:uncharacterized protein
MKPTVRTAQPRPAGRPSATPHSSARSHDPAPSSAEHGAAPIGKAGSDAAPRSQRRAGAAPRGKRAADAAPRAKRGEVAGTNAKRGPRPREKARIDGSVRARGGGELPIRGRKRGQAATALPLAAASLPRKGTRLPVYKETQPAAPSCTACGLCCSYVAIEVDQPSTVKRATQLLFYLYHEGVSLYENGDDWMVQFESTCRYLLPDYRCGVYTTRPHICREFSEQNCEVNTGDDGHTFYTAGQFMEHLKQTRPRVYRLVMKDYTPPPDPPRLPVQPFQRRARAAHARRAALGIAPPTLE